MGIVFLFTHLTVAIAAVLFDGAEAYGFKNGVCFNSMSCASLQDVALPLDLEIAGLSKGLGFEELVGLKDARAQRANASSGLSVHGHSARPVHDFQVRAGGLVTIVSGSNSERKWSRSVKENHEAYARSQGYLYKYINMTDWKKAAENKEPQWLKVLALLETLSTTESEHVLWVDDDVVFTSDTDFVNAMVEDMQEKSLLIARDIRLDQINTGMMLFRRGADARRILESMWDASDSMLGYCKDQSCFHEQDALNNLIEEGEVCAQVVDPVNELYNMNTMWRRSHYDERRKISKTSGTNMYLDYDESDPPSQRWRFSMNTAHVSGMTPSCRGPMLEWLVEYAKRFVFGPERNQSDFLGSDPYSGQCRDHLGKKARRGVLAQLVNRTTNSSQRPHVFHRSLAWDDFLTGFRTLTRAIDEPLDGEPLRRECMVNETADTAGSNATESDLLGPGVVSLAEIISSFLPDLLGADMPQVTRVDISVNYTSASPARHTGGISTELVVWQQHVIGQLVASDQGEYDFVEESSNNSMLSSGITTRAKSNMLRMRSGKAALSVGGRDLSLDFVENRHGAGLVFNYSWV